MLLLGTQARRFCFFIWKRGPIVSGDLEMLLP